MAAFSGSHRYVLDYLAEEVLERQSEQVRTFFLETSVLGRRGRTATFASQALVRLRDGETMLDFVTRWREAGQWSIAFRGCCLLGRVRRAQGKLDAAAGIYRQAVEIGAPPGRPALPAAGIGYLGLAAVAYQRNELDTALRDVAEGIALCRQRPNG